MWGRRKQTEKALAAAQAECRRLTAERDLAQAEWDKATLAGKQVAAARDEALAQRDQALSAAAKAQTAAAEAQSHLDSRPPPPSTTDEAIERLWPLVLADLARRWAATCGVPPGGRAATPGPTSAQLTEGLARETERLREEVGVDVSFTATSDLDPANPVVFLLTATDLLGALAASCERVTVELDGQLRLTGETWTELGDELETARSRAIAAGAAVDPIDIGDEQVRIVVQA